MLCCISVALVVALAAAGPFDAVVPPKQVHLDSIGRTSFMVPDNSTLIGATPPSTTLGATTSASAAASTADPARLRGPCCDDMDCSPGSPTHVPDCEARVDCSVLTCPPEPRKRMLTVEGYAAPDDGSDDCAVRLAPGNVCTCACRCVCVYPSGRVLWL